jgi:hypothetical protein
MSVRGLLRRHDIVNSLMCGSGSTGLNKTSCFVGLSRSISRASDVRRAVATQGETEGCERSLETGGFEQRGLSAWMPNSERSASHRSKPICCRRGVLERAG